MIKINSNTVKPNGIKLVKVGNNTVYEKPVSTVYIYCNGTLSNTINIEYSMDGTNWTTWLNGTSGRSSTITPTGTSISSSFTGLVLTDNYTGKKVAIRNIESTLSNGTTKFARFVMTGSISASGNVNSMINFANITSYCFTQLFYYCKSLTSAPELPATTLANYCYYQMFSSCTSLITPPSSLPATTLANECYEHMFSYCTSLSTAPILANITELTSTTQYCYRDMFYRCTSLKVNENGTEGTTFFTCPTVYSSSDCDSMFTLTGGTFTDTPTAGNVYKYYN